MSNDIRDRLLAALLEKGDNFTQEVLAGIMRAQMVQSVGTFFQEVQPHQFPDLKIAGPWIQSRALRKDWNSTAPSWFRLPVGFTGFTDTKLGVEDNACVAAVVLFLDLERDLYHLRPYITRTEACSPKRLSAHPIYFDIQYAHGVDMCKLPEVTYVNHTGVKMARDAADETLRELGWTLL